MSSGTYTTLEKNIRYRKVGGKRKYEFRRKTSDGTWVWKSVPGFDNLQEARDLRDETRKALKSGDLVVGNDETTFGQFVEIYFARPRVKPLSERTVRGYRRQLKSISKLAPWLERLPITEIKEHHLLQIYAAASRAKQAPLTIRNYHVLLGSILDYACHRDQALRSRNPARLLDKEERPRGGRKAVCKEDVLKPDEITKLLASANGKGSIDWQLIVETGLQTAARPAELLGITRRCVDVANNVIRIEDQILDDEILTAAPPRQQLLGHLKHGGEPRWVEITSTLGRRLRELMFASPFKDDDDLVFHNAEGKALQQQHMRKAMTWACTRAGIRRRTPHALRHTAASLMIDKGCTIEDVREALGHRDLETTLKTYVHFFDPDGAKQRRLEAKVAVFG